MLLNIHTLFYLIMNWIFRLFLALIFTTFLSCSDYKISPSGEITPKDFEVESFDKIQFSGDFKVFFKESKTNFVSVETSPNLIDNLKINVDRGFLYISEKRAVEKADFYNITVYGNKEINEIRLLKNANLSVEKVLMSNDLYVNLQDKSQLMAKILNQKTKVEMQQKSRLNFMGNCLDAEIKMADSASIIAPHWVINHLNINAKNATYTELAVKSELNGSLANTSQLIYYENPSKNLIQKDQSKVQQK